MLGVSLAWASVGCLLTGCAAAMGATAEARALSSQAVGPVQNGGFQTGDFSGWAHYTSDSVVKQPGKISLRVIDASKGKTSPPTYVAQYKVDNLVPDSSDIYAKLDQTVVTGLGIPFQLSYRLFQPKGRTIIGPRSDCKGGNLNFVFSDLYGDVPFASYNTVLPGRIKRDDGTSLPEGRWHLVKVPFDRSLKANAYDLEILFYVCPNTTSIVWVDDVQITAL